MRGGVLPLPQYTFMAWCSVKTQGQLYLHFISTGRDKCIKSSTAVKFQVVDSFGQPCSYMLAAPPGRHDDQQVYIYLRSFAHAYLWLQTRSSGKR